MLAPIPNFANTRILGSSLLSIASAAVGAGRCDAVASPAGRASSTAVRASVASTSVASGSTRRV